MAGGTWRPGLPIDPWHFETGTGDGRPALRQPVNGRTHGPPRRCFGGATGPQVFTTSTSWSADGAGTNPANGADAYDNLLGVGSGKYGMTIDTSAALGTIETCWPSTRT